MGFKKIRILGIAPYEGMKSLMMKLASQRNDLELDVFVGDLEKGAEIAKRNFNENYDVIVSRGGTAEMIGKIIDIPVIEISLSVYDILRAIKLAENYSNRYAIVGFPSITSSAHLLCDLLQYKIDIVTIHGENEVQSVLKDLKKNNYQMVLCDMIANTTAKQLGLNAILITSGREGIESAFDQAVKLSTSFSNIREENLFYQNIIRSQSSHTVVLDSQQQIFFSTLDISETEKIMQIIKKELPHDANSINHKFFKNVNGILYSVICKGLFFGDTPYTCYIFTASNVPVSGSKYGIRYSSKEDVEDQFFNSFYGITGLENTSHIQSYIQQVNERDTPLMICGETGTGKEQVARVIYSQGPCNNNPLITIDCSLMTDKSWNFLTNHYNSPFNDNNNTLYLCNIDALSEQQRTQLLSILVDMNVCKRNRTIFSCISGTGKPITQAGIDFLNKLDCITLTLPPLRDRYEEIPALSSLYLGTLNVSLAKQIIGFESDALELMKNFEWPYNYTQLKRVLYELVLITDTPYISTKEVEKQLAKEHIFSVSNQTEQFISASSADLIVSLDLNRSLDSINQDIIQFVLEKNNGNQTTTARQLGISRTTLWRMLK